MFKSHVNNVVVKVKTKYHTDFGMMMSRAALNPQSQINPAEYVQIIGEVVAVPKYISDRMDYKGYTTKDIYEGDMAIFRYDVIYDFAQKSPTADPIYKNEVFFLGESYFLADIQKVFAVIRAGEIIMVNGYVMIEDVSNAHGLILPKHLKSVIQASSAKLTHIGSPLTHQKPIAAQPGDTVYFHPGVLQSYEINGKRFGILRQRHILGHKVGSYSDIQQISLIS
jgi:co-chaperonin GroES (HSP10)